MFQYLSTVYLKYQIDADRNFASKGNTFLSIQALICFLVMVTGTQTAGNKNVNLPGFKRFKPTASVHRNCFYLCSNHFSQAVTRTDLVTALVHFGLAVLLSVDQPVFSPVQLNRRPGILHFNSFDWERTFQEVQRSSLWRTKGSKPVTDNTKCLDSSRLTGSLELYLDHRPYIRTGQHSHWSDKGMHINYICTVTFIMHPQHDNRVNAHFTYRKHVMDLLLFLHV